MGYNPLYRDILWGNWDIYLSFFSLPEMMLKQLNMQKDVWTYPLAKLT